MATPAFTGTPPAAAEREFAFPDSAFEYIARLIYQQAGIVIKAHKKEMVYGRLSRRLRALNLGDFPSYIRLLEGPQGTDELGNLVNALTTNLTRFFREPHHFELLDRTTLGERMAAREAQGTRRLRLWSAGCSSGMEPYSMAMVLNRHLMRTQERWDARILATDIDTQMLSTAADGRYSREDIAEVPPDLSERAFRPAPGNPDQVIVSDQLKALIRFRRLNLIQPWPFRGTFDIIFCRNVVIYFDEPTRRTLFTSFGDVLEEGGVLFIGHSETLPTLAHRFSRIGQSAYRLVRKA